MNPKLKPFVLTVSIVGLRFDTSGKPYNAIPGSPESFQSLGQAFISSAIARGAIAPQWEVQTAAMQAQAGDPQAGLTEVARAGRAGDLASAQTGSTQLWRPVVLDLNGMGIQTINAAQSGVAFNVDDSGYLKSTAWIGNNDAFLTIDRNYNGLIDSGQELFSNGAVGLGHRGVASLAAVDANYDGVINALDPVFNQMKLWQDKNGNGVVDAGEMTTLAQSGITALNYTMNSFVKDGVTRQMASPDLAASTAGDKVSVVPQGILVQSSGGQSSLLVTRVDDLTQVQANADHATGIENTELIVNSADLLKNDLFGGFTGKDLTLTGLLNVKHGTAFLDANGYVHFQADNNFYGEGASFDYSVAGPNGQTGTATVLLSMTHVNQAPTVAGVTHDSRAIYGYAPDSYDWNGNLIPGQPLYTPYDIFFYFANGYSYSTTPIAYEDTGSGQIVANDVDNATSSLTYTVVGQPQFGAVTVDATGHYQYTSWQSPGVASGPLYAGEPTSSDSFQVTVTDPLGASVTQTVNVTHYGTYTPPTPIGGGGGGKPIAIDMSQQGFSFTNVNDSNVFFDINGDGLKHRMSWIKPGEGLLAYDPNGTGVVTDASQISFARYLSGAQTDLAGMAAFDTNHDGIFSKDDASWSKFGLWMDNNQNGVVDAGEFKTLDQMGIASLSLVSDNQFSVVNGNTVHGVAKVTMTDGTTRNAADVTLAYSKEVQITNPDGTTSIVTPAPFQAGQQINAGEGNNLILASTGNTVTTVGNGNNVVFSGDGNDIIKAGDGNNVIYAGNGDDIIFAGAGNNTIYTGRGNDLITLGNGHNALFAEGGNDVIFAGNGNNLISGGNGNDVIRAGDGNNTINAGNGNTAVFAGNGDNVLIGGAGTNRFQVGNGNNTMVAGSGFATMIGGTGNNTFVVNKASDVVQAQAAGRNTVKTSVSFVTPVNVQNLTGIGSADITLTGNDLNNVITANSGNDTLIAGAGVTTMIGGTGNDIFVVNKTADIVQAVSSGTNVNTILSSVSYTASANVQNLSGTGSADIVLTGNELDNVIIGNSGNDTLIAGGGNDTLIAGSGLTTMIGGTGNDTFVINNVNDIILAQSTGSNINTVKTSVSFVTPANVQNLTGTGSADITLTGNDLNNVITANSGNDILVAGSGIATMIGGTGNDTFVVNNVNDIVLAQSTGSNINTILTSVSFVTPANVQNLTGTGSADITLTGNNLNAVITANSGNDTLIAGSGNNTLIGGTGHDIFVLNGGQQTIVDSVKASGDIVQFGAGITGWNTQYVRQGSDMLVNYGAQGGRALIKNFAPQGSGQVISQFEFADGSRSYYNADLQGNSSINIFDINWNLLADCWWHSDGSNGSDTYYANGSYQHSWTKLDGSRSLNSYNTATGEMIASNTTIGGGYSYTSEYIQNMGGVYGLTESKAAYVYADGSSYTSDYIGKADGSYRQTWASSNGSHGLTDYNAPTSAMIVNTTTVGAGYTSVSDYLQNIGGVYGYNESKASSVYANGTSSFSDYVQNIHGVYGYSESKATNINADGSSYTTDYLQNIDGVYGYNESRTINTYADGSTYNTDYVSYADGSFTQRWDKSDGSAASFTNNANGTWADSWVHMDGSQGVDAGNNHLLFGSSAIDTLTAPYGNSLLIGGAGNDTLVTGYGTNIIAFNKGDGQDALYASSGQNNTLSLGGNFAYNDLALQKSGNDLLLDVGTSDSITFKNWYAGSNNIVNLQVIASVMSDFNPGSTDVLRNSNVENFDFQKLVNTFDQAQAVNPGLNAWGVSNSLLDAHLAASNSSALGGDFAYVYGTHGNLTGFGVAAAQGSLSNSQFAAVPQALTPWPVLNTGTAQIR